jgi:hypothetical protein
MTLLVLLLSGFLLSASTVAAAGRGGSDIFLPPSRSNRRLIDWFVHGQTTSLPRCQVRRLLMRTRCGGRCRLGELVVAAVPRRGSARVRASYWRESVLIG